MIYKLFVIDCITNSFGLARGTKTKFYLFCRQNKDKSQLSTSAIEKLFNQSFKFRIQVLFQSLIQSRLERNFNVAHGACHYWMETL